MGRRFIPSRSTRQDDAAHHVADGHSETAWKAMTSIEADEADRWSRVEEHLLAPHDAKRWKFFAK